MSDKSKPKPDLKAVERKEELPSMEELTDMLFQLATRVDLLAAQAAGVGQWFAHHNFMPPDNYKAWLEQHNKVADDFNLAFGKFRPDERKKRAARATYNH